MEIKDSKEIKGKLVATFEADDDVSLLNQLLGMENDGRRDEFVRELERKELLTSQKNDAKWVEGTLRELGFIPAGPLNDLKQYPIDALTFPPKAFPKLHHEVVQYPARTDEDRELEEIGLFPRPRAVEEAIDDLPQEVIIPQEKRGTVKHVQAGDDIPEAPAPKDRIVGDAVIHTRALPPTGLFKERAEPEQESALVPDDNVSETAIRERTAEEIRDDRIHSRIQDIARTTRSEIVTTATMPYDDKVAKIFANNGEKKPVEVPREFMLGRIQVFNHVGDYYPDGGPARAHGQRVLYITHPNQPSGLIIAQTMQNNEWKTVETQTATHFLKQNALPQKMYDAMYFGMLQHMVDEEKRIPEALKAFESMSLKQHSRRDEWPVRFVRRGKDHLDEFSITRNKAGVPVVNYEVTYLDAGNKGRTTRMKMHSFQLEDFTNMVARNDKLQKLERPMQGLPMKKIGELEWIGALDKLMHPTEVLSRRMPSHMDRQFRIASRHVIKKAEKLAARALEAGQNLAENTANAAREQFDKVRERMPDLHIGFDLQPARALARILSILKF